MKLLQGDIKDTWQLHCHKGNILDVSLLLHTLWLVATLIGALTPLVFLTSRVVFSARIILDPGAQTCSKQRLLHHPPGFSNCTCLHTCCLGSYYTKYKMSGTEVQLEMYLFSILNCIYLESAFDSGLKQG